MLFILVENILYQVEGKVAEDPAGKLPLSQVIDNPKNYCGICPNKLGFPIEYTVSKYKGNIIFNEQFFVL